MLVILGILLVPFVMIGLLFERKPHSNARRTRWD